MIKEISFFAYISHDYTILIKKYKNIIESINIVIKPFPYLIYLFSCWYYKVAENSYETI